MHLFIHARTHARMHARTHAICNKMKRPTKSKLGMRSLCPETSARCLPTREYEQDTAKCKVEQLNAVNVTYC